MPPLKHDLPPSLASLLAKLVDRGLDELENARLEEILSKNPAAREYYRLYLSTHLELAETASQIRFKPTTPLPWLHRFRKPLAIAALFPLAIAIALWAPWKGGHQSSPKTILAVTSVTENTRWNLEQSPAAGIHLHASRIELTSGKLALNLTGNQLLTLAAPTDFELISENEVFLHRGSASLRIAGKGQPYAIRVPNGTVVDLGTEFSVNVAKNGAADVWVFEGKALVSLTEGTAVREKQALTAGQSVRMGETLAPSPTGSSDFIRPLMRNEDRADSPPTVIADFSAEFPGSTLGSGQPFGGTEEPSKGWNYLWNPTGTLGIATTYKPLSPNTVNTFPAADGGGIFPMFTKLGDLAFNSTKQGNFQYGRIAKTSIHPGRYVSGKDYRAIIAYTIQPEEAGNIRIANSSLAKHRVDGFITNGVDLDIFVNDTKVDQLRKDGFESLAASDFDGNLGTLTAGDTIYITLGNNGDDGNGNHDVYDAFDACIIDFQLVREL